MRSFQFALATVVALLPSFSLAEHAYYIKTATDDNFCLTLPTSQYRNGLVPILAQCTNSPQQMFRFDPFEYYIQPADDIDWCLDFDFDDKKYRPLTLFKCGFDMSGLVDSKHQRWKWPNYRAGESGPLRNRGTDMCVGVGKDIYAGKYLQQFDCDIISEFDFVLAED